MTNNQQRQRAVIFGGDFKSGTSFNRFNQAIEEQKAIAHDLLEVLPQTLSTVQNTIAQLPRCIAKSLKQNHYKTNVNCELSYRDEYYELIVHIPNNDDDITTIIMYFAQVGNTFFCTQFVRNGPKYL